MRTPAKKSFALLLLLVGLSACAVTTRSTSSPAELRRALRSAADRRDPADPAVERGLSSHLPELRIAALRVLARSEEVGTSTPAARLLGDTDPEVASWAAFTLGQLADAHGEASLIESLHGVAGAPDQVLIALGRSGTASTALMLSDWLGAKDPKVRAGAALGLGLAAKRMPGVLPADGLLPRIAPLLESADRDLRFAASYALLRLATPKAGLMLSGVLRDVDPEIRANAVRGIGLAQLSPQLLDVALSDPDWRVRVEAVRSLGKIGAANPPDAGPAASRIKLVVSREVEATGGADRLASGRALHVLRAAVEAATALGESGDPILLEIAERTAEISRPSEETADDRARLDCELAFALDLRDGLVRRIRDCGRGMVPAWRRWQLETRILAKKEQADVAELMTFAGHGDDRVGVSAVESLSEVEGEAASKALVDLLQSPSPYVASGAASFLAERIAKGYRAEGLLEALTAGLSAALARPDAGFSIAYLDAIAGFGADAARLLSQLEALSLDGRVAVRRRAALARRAITGVASRIGSPPTASPVDRPELLLGSRILEVDSSRGRFAIELDGDLAPRTTGTLVALARAHFFDGKTFHRVVPGFVVQGGGSRGDGWGGPGYTIEDECSLARFEPGALGIATAGRDTGGSQFFVMHSQHPHLEGAYTVAGRVLEGLDVVMALQVDDRMLRVHVRGDDAPAATTDTP